MKQHDTILGGAWMLTPMIPATWEVEIGRLWFEASSDKKELVEPPS
jgi:hypothetical protein